MNTNDTPVPAPETKDVPQVHLETRDNITTVVRPGGFRHGLNERLHGGTLLYSDPFHDKHGRVVRFIHEGKAFNRVQVRSHAAKIRCETKRGLRKGLSFDEALKAASENVAN